MKKAFRVQCDFYEPESDEWLRCQYLFKNLYILRDQAAREANVGPEHLISTEHLYMLARQEQKTDLQDGDNDFITKAADKI